MGKGYDDRMNCRWILPPLAAGFLFLGQALGGDPDLVATGQGVEIDRATLEQSAQADLDKLDLEQKRLVAEMKKRRYNILSEKLQELVGKRVLELEAETRGISAKELYEEATADVPPPTEQEIDQVYETNKSRFNQPKEQVIPRIETFLKQKKSREAFVAYVEKLAKKYDVQYHLEPLRFSVSTEGSPTRGPADAPVTIIEFSDFQCPYCAQAHGTIQKIVDKYGAKIRLVFRQFPLTNIHHNAQEAAEASLCAADQGKFWEMYDALFADQSKLAGPQLKETAKTLGLDEQAFDSCLDSHKFATEVTADVSDGVVAGVSGTPAFFINGRPLNGAVDYDTVAKIVDEELAATAGTH